MIVKNREELIASGDKKIRAEMLDILDAAIDAIDPYGCVKGALQVDGNKVRIGNERLDLGSFDRIFVVGAGKASARMAEAINDLIGEKITAGIVNTIVEGRVGKIVLHKATHPHPGAEGLEGALKIKQICEGAGERDLVICLISGGGSAMMPCPAEGITLEEKKITAEMLMLAGATIEELNTVRRHLSCLKGGNLARAAFPATVLSLIISDVINDPLESIASGPTAPDPTTFSDALQVLRKYGLLGKVPQSVRERLERGGEENPKPGDPIFKKVKNVIVASNRIALEAALQRAKEHGYEALVLTSSMRGEARDVGRAFARLGKEILRTTESRGTKKMIIAGGETTVTVRGKGMGGRNCELVLSALLELEEGITILSYGTDGIDGNSDAGGAIADSHVFAEEAVEYLANNDSYSYFKKYGGLIFTGPTGTNVGDIVLLAVSRKE
ncbi:MAG: glycerate kinase [Methanomassiliicoccales archaeon]|nr:glycerate kinase [Methanomassiliicoccales archaeon]